MIVRRKCFNASVERNAWTGVYKNEDGYETRHGNAIQAATGSYGPNTERQVKIDGKWMKESDADYYLRRRDNYKGGATAAESHEKNNSKWVSPWEKEQENQSHQAELREQVPSVVEPGKEQEFLDLKAQQERAEKLRKGGLIGAGVAVAGAAGYGAYKAWKKKQAKKKAAASEAANKFKK